MSRKRNRDAKRGGNIEVNAKTGGVQAPHAVGIGAVVSGPCTGNHKITAEIASVTGDKIGLVIGAMVRGCTEEES